MADEATTGSNQSTVGGNNTGSQGANANQGDPEALLRQSPFGPLFDFPHSDHVETIVTSHGGHLGFLGLPGVDKDFRWLDWRILEWLADPYRRQTIRDVPYQACTLKQAH